MGRGHHLGILLFTIQLSSLTAAVLDLVAPQVASQPVPNSDGFDKAAAVEVGPDGLVYGTFARQRALRIVDPSTLKTTTVRLDQPELSPYPGRMGWVGDTLWVMNWTQSSVVLFDGSWRVARSFSFWLPGRAGEVKSLAAFGLLPEDRIMVSTTASLMAMALGDSTFEYPEGGIPSQMFPSGPVRDLPVWIADSDGSVLAAPLSLSTRNRAAVLFPPDGTGVRQLRMRQTVQPFGDYPLVTTAPDGSCIVVVDRHVSERTPSPTFGVLRISPSGDTLLLKDVPFTPMELRSAWIDERAATLGSGLSDDDAEAAASARAQMFIPQWLPPVSQVLVDLDGWVWVRREDVPGAAHRVWQIISPSGAVMRSVRVPSHLRLRAVHRFTAWATEETQGDGRLWRITATPGDASSVS